MKILVTQVSKFGSVSWIKCLKRINGLNIKIYGCDIIPYGYSTGSQLVDYYFQTNTLNDAQYADFILDFCDKNEINLLLSAMDNEINMFIHYQQLYSKMIVPTIDCFELFYNKLKASIAISDLGIQIPDIINNPFGEKKVIIRDKIGIGSRGIYIIDLETEQYIENRFQDSRFMQKFISGTEYTVDVLTNNSGTPVLIVPRQRLEIQNGISFKCKVTYDCEIINICKKIYSKYKIPGISNVQFIKNDDNIFFIELNPRIGGSTIASVLSGFNFIELFLKHYILKEEMEGLEQYMKLVAWDSVITRTYEELVYLM
jgi:carbamoyl-phosphate synthase large subunit